MITRGVSVGICKCTWSGFGWWKGLSNLRFCLFLRSIILNMELKNYRQIYQMDYMLFTIFILKWLVHIHYKSNILTIICIVYSTFGNNQIEITTFMKFIKICMKVVPPLWDQHSPSSNSICIFSRHTCELDLTFSYTYLCTKFGGNQSTLQTWILVNNV